MVYVNVFLTFNYTFRVVKYILSCLNQPSPILVVSSLTIYHYIMFSFLGGLSVFFSSLYFYSTDFIPMVREPLFH